jgi:tRNA A37 methylthiotransferase MiaB
MNDTTIIAISAGLKKPKKEFNSLSRKNLYLNYGLLGLATILSEKGYKVKMFQGDYYEPLEIINRIKKSNINLSKLHYPILLSIPSYFAIPWAKDFCRILKSNYKVKIVAGGRWVVGKDENWLINKIPEIDLVLCGLGDNLIEKCINPNLWDDIKNGELDNNGRTTTFKNFDFSLVYDFIDYQPCIEVSRGCGRGCSFCMEKDIPLTLIKEPEDVINEIKDITNVYKSEDINLYFEASLFNPSLNWAKKLKLLYQKENLKIRWRCETRVDSISSEILEELSYAGLKVIDLGLESASIKQLINMKKTKKAEEYLEKAKELLVSCKKFGVWVKVNILLYAGETLGTITETKEWLKKNSDYIKGVSVNPLLLYGYDANINQFILLGASPVNENNNKECGYGFMNLSKEIDYKYSKEISMEISRAVMNMQDYFELKKVCYFPRSYSYDDFKQDVYSSKKEELPFNI